MENNMSMITSSQIPESTLQQIESTTGMRELIEGIRIEYNNQYIKPKLMDTEE